MRELKSFLHQEVKKKSSIYPKGKHIFNALNHTPVSKVRVVILGQDPYHGPGQAHGLCFSVPRGVTPPPSLRNIFKEIHTDLDLPMPSHGDLTHWAEQGVFLLNTVLTVRKGAPASHRGQGWEQFTDEVIEVLGKRSAPIIFLLWGSFAQAKVISGKHHIILKAPHPSPLSAYRGFLGCRHFSKTNEYLRSWKQEEIDWSLPG